MRCLSQAGAAPPRWTRDRNAPAAWLGVGAERKPCKRGPSTVRDYTLVGPTELFLEIPRLDSLKTSSHPLAGCTPSPPPTQDSVSGQHWMARRGENADSCCVFTHPAPSLVRYVTPPPTAFYPPYKKRVSRSLAGRITGNAHPPHLQLYPPYRCAASYSTVHLSRACVAGALHTALQLPRTCVAATLYLRSRWHRIAAPLQRSAVQLRHSSGEGRAFRCWLVVAEHGPFEQRIS